MRILNAGRLPSILVASLTILFLAGIFATILEHVRGTPGAPATTTPAQVPDLRTDGERTVEAAQQRLAAAPDDPRATTLLAQAYLLRMRETGDPAYYNRADALLQRVLLTQPDNVPAITAAGSLALSRHEFAAALSLGRQAVALAPHSTGGYGVLTDALVELGQYDEAVATAQQMVDLRPDLASYSRVSYLRELHGDLPGAADAMRLAVQSGAPSGEATAWSEVQLGHLLFAQGDLTAAAQAYQSSLRRIDGYVFGLAGLARVRAARGDFAGAVALYERVTRTMPLPELVIALGDSYTRQGDLRRAQEQYALVRAEQQLFAANGVRTDLDLALFNADHGVELDSALQAAETEYAIRPSVQVADVLAWVKYRRGDPAGARVQSLAALKLGTRDPLMLYRAGVIAQANDEVDRAYDLLTVSSELNPRFSILWSEDLAVRLRQLSSARGDRCAGC